MLRYERKYYVKNTDLPRLRKRLMPFLRADINTSTNEEGFSQYTVRSIYFDTPFLDYYYEKMEGLEERSKFRIRVYDEFNKDDVAFLEIKQKIGPRIKKYRSTVLVREIEKLLREGDIEKYVISKPASASKFLYHYYRYGLKPVNLVAYEREAYHGKFDPGVRITFDKNVRAAVYPDTGNFYDEQSLKVITPDFFILEVKYYFSIPCWARSVLEEFDLQLEAISKYSTGIDVHHKNSRKRFSPIGFTRMY